MGCWQQALSRYSPDATEYDLLKMTNDQVREQKCLPDGQQAAGQIHDVFVCIPLAEGKAQVGPIPGSHQGSFHKAAWGAQHGQQHVLQHCTARTLESACVHDRDW